MLWRHVWIVHGHAEKSPLRKDIFGLGPIDHRLEGGNYPVHLEGLRHSNIGDLSFGKVDKPHRKSGSFFFYAHGKNIFLPGAEFFANLAIFDLAGFSKLTWRGLVAGPEGTRKSC